MSGRRVVAGCVLLCVLGFSALAAPSALGAKLNTTAFTCKAVEKGAQFSDEHCTKAGEGKGFVHEAIPVNKSTELSGTNEKTGGETKSALSAELRFEVSGVEIEVTCTSVATTTGYLENHEKENEKKEKEMLMTFIKVHALYSGCTVLAPLKQNCKVAAEKFELFTDTDGATSYGTKMAIEFPRMKGSISIEKCSSESLNGKYEVEGSLRAEPNGATLKTTGAATALTLLVNKLPAELVSSLTLRARSNLTEGETVPISFTTG